MQKILQRNNQTQKQNKKNQKMTALQKELPKYIQATNNNKTQKISENITIKTKNITSTIP